MGCSGGQGTPHSLGPPRTQPPSPRPPQGTSRLAPEEGVRTGRTCWWLSLLPGARPGLRWVPRGSDSRTRGAFSVRVCGNECCHMATAGGHLLPPERTFLGPGVSPGCSGARSFYEMPLDKAGPGRAGAGRGGKPCFWMTGGKWWPAQFSGTPGPKTTMSQRLFSQRRRPRASALVAKPLPSSRGARPGSAGGLTWELS